MVFQTAVVLAGNGFASFQNGFNALELGGAEGAIQFGDSIVVAELFVLEPIGGIVAAVIAKFTSERGEFRIVCDDHTAFAGGDLFIGIEAKNPNVSEGSNFAAVELRAEGFASVFDDMEIVTASDFQDVGECGRTSESVHDDDGAGSRGDGFFDAGGIEIERVRIDINENGDGTLVAENVGDGDEGERWNDDFIAVGDAEGANAEMERGRAGTYGNGMRSANVVCEGVLKLFHLGAEA